MPTFITVHQIYHTSGAALHGHLAKGIKKNKEGEKKDKKNRHGAVSKSSLEQHFC